MFRSVICSGSNKIFKNQNIAIAITGFLALSSSVVFADPFASESGLQKKIHEGVERTYAADAKKYDQVSALAGGKRRELSAKKIAVTKTYNEWHQLNAAVSVSRNPDAAQYKALEAAAEKYARASKEFMDLQKDILAKKGASPDNIISAEAINALNAAAPSAAGRKVSKSAARKSPKKQAN